MAPGVQALSGSASWVVQPPSLVRAPKGRSGVAPTDVGAAVVGVIGSGTGGGAPETCAVGGAVLAALDVAPEQALHARETAMPIIHAVITAWKRSPPHEPGAPPSARTGFSHRSAVRAVLDQQASGVLDLP